MPCVATYHDLWHPATVTITIDPRGLNIKTESPEHAAQVIKGLRDRSVSQKTAQEVLSDYPEIRDIIFAPGLSKIERLMRARSILAKTNTEIQKKEKDKKFAEWQLERCETYLAGHEQFKEWITKDYRLEKNDCSRLHTLVEGLIEQKHFIGEALKGGDPEKFPWNEIQPFVVQHDWAGAFKNAGDYAEGGYNLPYEMCAFEFRVSGASITVLADQLEGEQIEFTYYAKFNGIWISPDEETAPRLLAYVREQIKAICVALDAEVAEHHVQRSNDKVNARRKSEGKVPFYSYRIVSLSSRKRVTNANEIPVIGKRKRIHFRRGHWRHYEKFKTWVRWCLVGDPELGFIDKEYRL